MDANRFDDLLRTFSAGSRRGLARALFGIALAGPLGIRVDMEEAAAKKKKKKKTTLCLDGQTIQAAKKQKKKLLQSGATPGACPASPPPPPGCTPDCTRKICGDDGCGSTCGPCSLCQECRDGRCEPKATDSACGGGCKECQGGQCVNKPNGTQCPEADSGRCRDGVCNPIPQCGSFLIDCIPGPVCCYQAPGDTCPPGGKCNEKAADGHRCRFDPDCAIGSNCVGYICDPA